MLEFVVHTTEIRISTFASDSDQAVRQVLDFEGAPDSALRAIYQSNPTPNLDAGYGAPMGRQAHSLDHDNRDHWTATHIPLDEGYDPGGAYWGMRPTGVSLYCVQDGMGNLTFVDAAGEISALSAAEEL